MKKELKNKISVWFTLTGDLIKKPTKNGAIIILERTYYEEEGMSDLALKPKKFWLFVRHFELRITSKGTPVLETKRDVVEIEGKSEKEMCNKLEKYCDSCYGQVPEKAERNWIPNDFLETKKSIVSGALKI